MADDKMVIVDAGAEQRRMVRRLKKAFGQQIKTGSCGHCGRDLINRRPDARYCSAKCRTAACRKDLPPPATREVQRLQALVQHLEAENTRLQALVQQMEAERASPPGVTLTERERELAAEARQAKIARYEERSKRAMARMHR
jgi:hypothetical protein